MSKKNIENLSKLIQMRKLPINFTLSGCVGSGKTTIGKLLAEHLNYSFISIGNRTREFAESKGMSIVEFQKLCLSKPEMDMQIDKAFSNECNNSERLVIDYRLGFKFIKNAYHIFLNISEACAKERLKLANRATESYETVNQRNESFKNQFLNTYSVDYTLPENYDLLVHVADFSNPEDMLAFIINSVLNTQKK
jgi:cytidylate kinase